VNLIAGEREALLIAVGDYENPRLKRLRSPVQDAAELAAVLEDPAIGSFTVKSEINKPHYEITQSIERFFQHRSPGDLLLVHLSCHGIKDEDGSLYFATSNTNPDLPASTAISSDFLRIQLQRSRAKSIVLLLDCCYSGCFLTGMKAGDQTIDIREELAGHGRAVITATNRTEYAWEGQNLVELEPEPSRFTGVIVNGLRTGDADLDGDGKIAVDELYEYVYAELRRAKIRQTPRKWVDLEYQVFLASSKRRAVRLSRHGAIPGGEHPVPKYRTQRGEDQTIRVELPLAETAFGAVRELSVETFIRCAECGATGNRSREMPACCTDCLGKGVVDSDSGALPVCHACDGFGTVIQDPCPACQGEGRVRVRRSLRVRTPKGIEHGTLIQLASEGEVGSCGGPPGDLFLEVVELRDPRFSRRGDDLLVAVRIPSSLAAHGGTFDVKTLEGIKKVRIPAGQVGTGSVVRLSGEGVPHLNRDGDGDLGRGDLMVKVTLE
jgi:molecular chaperone DnaJ